MLRAHTGTKPETPIDGVRRHWASAPATGCRLVPPMRAWLTPPHGRHHKAPPPPCALTTTHYDCGLGRNWSVLDVASWRLVMWSIANLLRMACFLFSVCLEPFLLNGIKRNQTLLTFDVKNVVCRASQASHLPVVGRWRGTRQATRGPGCCGGASCGGRSATTARR